MKHIFSGDRPSYALILSAGCLWGIIGIFVNQLNACSASPAFLSFLQVSLACIIPAGATAFKCGIRSLLVPWRTLLICALLRLVCQGFLNLFYCMAILCAGVMVSAVLLYLAPLLPQSHPASCLEKRNVMKTPVQNKNIFVIQKISGCIY